MPFQPSGFDIALILSLGWFVLVMWLIWRAFRQQGAIRQVTPRGAAAEAPQVAVIVPARNESANIGPCLRSLMRQRYPADRLSIVVVDDHSDDGTAAIAAGSRPKTRASRCCRRRRCRRAGRARSMPAAPALPRCRRTSTGCASSTPTCAPSRC